MSGSDSEDEGYEPSSELEDCYTEIEDAMKSGDAKALVDALSRALPLYEGEDDDDGEKSGKSGIALLLKGK